MPDGGWAKAASSLTPEHIENAKAAIELHKAQMELKKQGLLPPDDGEEGEGEEGDEWEDWFDRVIGKSALVVVVVAGLAALAARGWGYLTSQAGEGAADGAGA